MLVLSRRQNDKLVFPHLGITLEILKIAGRSVRIGVEAPPHVRVLRHELAEAIQDLAQDLVTGQSGMSNHRLRNRLNKLGLGLHLMERQCETGRHSEAEGTLQKVLAEFQSLDEELAPRETPHAPSSTCRALLVEDDANESELLAGFLRINGFDVDTASDGCDALDYLSRREQPHIILLDMQMPRCDGPTMLSAIRENPEYQGLKVFGVSGQKPEDVGVDVGPEGVDRWFTKPVNPQTLVVEMKRDLKVSCCTE